MQLTDGGTVHRHIEQMKKRIANDTDIDVRTESEDMETFDMISGSSVAGGNGSHTVEMEPAEQRRDYHSNGDSVDSEHSTSQRVESDGGSSLRRSARERHPPARYDDSYCSIT